MWRNGYDIEWTIENDCLCIKSGREGGLFMLPPLHHNNKALASVLDKMETYFMNVNRPFMLRGVTQNCLQQLEAIRPGYYSVEEDRDNFDYIYAAQDLIELEGRKFHSKKNHINRFLREYGEYYEYSSLSREIVPECIKTAIEWCKRRGCAEDKSLQAEKEAIIDVLSHFEQLQLKGGVIRINDKVEAFTFGEKLNPEMALIHVEKANPEINGIYTMINSEFCRQEWIHMKYINREEDMGLEGLRKAKQSYHPVKMIEKYILTLRK